MQGESVLMDQAPSGLPGSSLADPPSPAAALGGDAGFWPEDEEEEQAADAFLAPARVPSKSPRAPAATTGDLAISDGDRAESGDADILQIPFGDGDEEDEGWEGLDELDLPAQEAQTAESTQEDEDESAQVPCFACCGLNLHSVPSNIPANGSHCEELAVHASMSV